MNSMGTRRGLAWLGGSVVCLLAVAAARGGQAANAPKLHLRTGEVSLAPANRQVQTVQDNRNAAAPQIIQFRGPLDAKQRAAIVRTGVRLGEYLPDHAYVVDLRGADRAALAQLDFVHHLGLFQAAWKLDPRLSRMVERKPRSTKRAVASVSELRAAYRRNLTTQRASLLDAGRVRVLVTCFPGTTSSGAQADLATLPGAAVRSGTQVGDGAMVTLDVPLSALDNLAAAPFVQFVEDAPNGVLRNDVTVAVVQSGTDTATPVWDLGLHGENQIVGLIDSPPYLTHCMFSDVVAPGPTHRKFAGYRSVIGDPSWTNHGALVAGTLAGDSGVEGAYDTYDGVAYAARISFSDYFDVDDDPDTLIARLTDAHNDGARIHSNSWGDDGTTAYTSWCRQADLFSHDNEDDLVVFSVTNGASLRTPENAKNVLSVGATEQYPNHNSHGWGGSGPTFDGRRKPDVFTPGVGIRSAVDSACATSTGSGTSHACPSVSASAALARQYYVEGFYPDGLAIPGNALTPSGALMKATLLSSAVNMTAEAGYPSNLEGWGRLELQRSLPGYGSARRTIVRDIRNASGLITGGSVSFDFTVWSADEDLRVTLVFTDPPAVVNATHPVINNLDLTLVAPAAGESTDLYRGNYFLAEQSAPDGSADALNNVEQIYLPSPPPGVYTLTVSATAVNSFDPQGFALVIAGHVGDGGSAATFAAYGDADSDNDWDLSDFGEFQSCFGAPGSPYPAPGCAVFDADFDGDVDLNDYTTFRTRFAGPAAP